MLHQSRRDDVAPGTLPKPRWPTTPHLPARMLVLSGVAMFVLYIAMDVIASLTYGGYSYRDQTISELSAIGAPTRALWLAMSPFYQLLTFAFAFGVLGVAGDRGRIRLVGWLLLAAAVVGLLWWIAPMHQREVLAADGGTWQDTVHLVLGGVSSVFFLATIGIGAFVFGTRFRLLSFAFLVLIVALGVLVGASAEAVGNDEPTPWLGVWERITVQGSMLWQAVFAAVLFHKTRPEATGEGRFEVPARRE